MEKPCSFWKTMENMRKYRDVKGVTTEERRNDLVIRTKLSCNKFFSENLLAVEMKKKKQKKKTKTNILNKPVYLGLSIFGN